MCRMRGDFVELICLETKRPHQNAGPLQRNIRMPTGFSPMRVGLRRFVLTVGSLVAAPFLIAVAGCGTATVTANSVNSAFSISPATAAIDTNCNRCNANNARGLPVHRFAARSTNGAAAPVTWSVSGGDAVAGPGSITAAGEYTPPSYLAA